MVNGTRCNECGKFVYARDMDTWKDPIEYICSECRQEDRVPIVQ